MDTLSRKRYYQYYCVAVLWTCWVMSRTCTADTLDCPEYCNCGIKSGLKRVQCIQKGLINVDIGAPPRLQWLQLSYNSIYSIEDNIFLHLGLTKMVVLDMDHNSVRYTGLDAFKGLKYLERVDLSYNHLNHLQPALFEHNRSLKTLNLTANPLKFIDHTSPFLSSKSLQILEISGCGLPHLPWTAFGLLPIMKMLNVSHNQMVTLDKSAFTVANSLATVDITGNPLICDSHIYQIDEMLKSKSIKLLGSPCEAIATPAGGQEPKKMEKLTMIVDSDQDSDEYYDTEDYEDYKQEQEKEKMDCQCEKLVQQVRVNPVEQVKVNIPMMLSLAGLAGVATGIFLVTAMVLIKRMMEASRERNRRRRWNNLRASVPEGTPPPALFDNLSLLEYLFGE